MNSLPKTHHYHHHLSFTHTHSSFPIIPFSFSFSFSFPSHPFSSSSIKASSSPSPKNHNPFHQKPRNAFFQLLQTLNPIFSPLFEPAYVAIAVIAFFLIRIQHNPAAATSTLLPPPPAESSTATTATTKNQTSKENNSAIEEQLKNNSNDANALRSLVEENVRALKLSEAIRFLDRLIELEPEDFDLHLLKAHLHRHNGEHELAKISFELVLKQEPVNIEAYRGLLMTNLELNEPMESFLNRVDQVVKFFEEQKMDSEVREFKLLIAQVKVMEEDYSGALKVYEEIVKQEPRDFRPYLCQGVVYTLLRKNDEAEKQFEEYRRLVPENHPYKEYFENNTKIFSRKLEREGIDAKSLDWESQPRSSNIEVVSDVVFFIFLLK
uniref:Protein SLOW GREEN 1, chloroplastic-like n=1 Tax=Cicer arietinum TaxID=3827 RepID=A0A1S2XVR4_CICAR|nr:protein SLOW GREEN 1, chloroplastic-like [Cicer arietinum]